MLILILVLILVAYVIFARLTHKHINSYDFGVASILFGFVATLLIIPICSLASKVATAYILDEKIAMYQQENAIIEQDIDKIIQEYLEHEKNTFSDLKTEESAITLVTLFPELKSDTLVQQQLEIYVANNASIKSLKTEKIDIAKLKWILYFGK